MVMRELKKEVWPYKVVIQRKKDGDDGVTNKEIWLGTHLGTYRGRWNILFRPSEIHFYFRHQADAVMFSLRWA